MTSKTFLLRLLLIVLGITALTISINIRTDLYGLFRSGRGPYLKVYGEERNCKYLFSFRYIPENFDALMLGSSVSDNIPVRTVAGLRVYNASLNGGNMTEAKDLGINALRRGHFKLVILSLHRYLMQNPGQKTNFMIPARYWGALGSIQLFTASLGRLLDQAGIKRSAFDSYGAQSYGPSSPSVRDEIERFASQLRHGERNGWRFDVDPRAYLDLQELTQTVHQRGALFVGFYPPMPTAIQESTTRPLADFEATVLRAFGPEDVFIDFNRPDYRFISDENTNYREAAHLSDAGGRAVAAELDRVITAVLAQRRGGMVPAPLIPGGQ